jgi:prephenate dehydrogenase
MIGVIGFGRFGRLAVRYLARELPVWVYSLENGHAEAIRALGARPAELEAVCTRKIVLLCVPISAIRALLLQIAPLLRVGTLVADVCSVKLYPVLWMQEHLPAGVDILATHPLFGPDSAALSLAGHKIALCPVRIRQAFYRRIRQRLAKWDLILIEITPDEHDRQVALSLGLTHFIGRGLERMAAPAPVIDTCAYRRLRQVEDTAKHDTFQLFEDMHRYNPHARGAREALLQALAQLNQELLAGDT